MANDTSPFPTEAEPCRGPHLEALRTVTEQRRRRPGIASRAAPPDALGLVLAEQSLLPGSWTCDRCGTPIRSATDGRLEWIWSPVSARASGLQIVHTREASPPQRRLRAVGSAGTVPPSQGCGHAPTDRGREVLGIPLHHLTDADGLMQLLEMIAAGRLAQETVLEVIQRIHIPLYEAARPHLAAAIAAGRIRPNLTDGFHWQGDLAEVLRFAGTDALRDRHSPPACRIATDLFAARPEIHAVVSALASAGLAIQSGLGRAASGTIRSTPRNVNGDEIKPADRFAEDLCLDALRACRAVGAVLSEETAEPILFDRAGGACVVAIDPLDGSDNVGPGLSVGTIFSIRAQSGATARREDFLTPGRAQLAAGYLLYGYDLQLVVTDGERVDWLIYDASTQTFAPRAIGLRAAAACRTLSINEAHEAAWPDALKLWVDALKRCNAADPGAVASRFLGTLVADIHRNLLSGGVLIVPRDANRPEGKLRLIYECAPMALILAAAGGRALDLGGDVLDLVPHDPHQRCGFFALCASDAEAFTGLADMLVRPDSGPVP